MNTIKAVNFVIRNANPEEYQPLGELTAAAYEQLNGMPSAPEQPDYYGMIRDVEGRARKPSVEILAAVSADGVLLGGVTFVGDMADYGSGGTAGTVANSSGIRLLAVRPSCRRHGVGRALTEACIRRAVQLGKSRIVLHTTKAMQLAWRLYEHMGFHRSPDLDFMQGRLEVFGFCLTLKQQWRHHRLPR